MGASGEQTAKDEIEITEADARAFSATAALRARLREMLPTPLDKDALQLAASLGRVLAQEGASPTLAATVLDSLLDDCSSPGPLRAALFEAYSATRSEASQREASRAWEFPHCAVPLDEGRFAVCAGFPDPDPTEITDWADRVAAALLRSGAKRVELSGSGRPRASLEEALGLVGVPCSSEQATPSRAEGRGLFRLPWRR